MQQQIITHIENYIKGLYLVTRSILLEKSNYSDNTVNLNTVDHYLTFLEASLQKPYNRLYSLSAFVEGDNGLMVQFMYPFALLSTKAKENIKNISIQAVQLATALDVSEIDPEYETLTTEPRISNNLV